MNQQVEPKAIVAVNINQDLHKAFRIAAAIEDRSMSSLGSELIGDYLRQYHPDLLSKDDQTTTE